MKTITDIINEMISYASKSKDGVWYDNEKWLKLCDSIQVAYCADKLIARKEAYKNGYIAGALSGMPIPTCKESLQVGNAAKMREALEELIENIEMRSSTFGLNVVVDTKTFLDAKAALSAPPRNCDRFDNGTDARVAWDEYCTSENLPRSATTEGAFVPWLFAEAKGENK